MTKTILIIDDEPDIRDYLVAVLKDHDYTPYALGESDLILEAVIKHRPDLIILDVMMPERSGISVYIELRTTAETAHIPIALLTGLTANTLYARTGLLQLLETESIPPPNGFIDKPIDIPSLLSSIKSLLDEGRDPSDVAT